LAEYSGEYGSEELLTSYRVEANDGELALWHLRHGKIALSHLHKDDFGSSIYSLSSIEFQRSADGKVKGFWVYTRDQRNRRIEFVKQR